MPKEENMKKRNKPASPCILLLIPVIIFISIFQLSKPAREIQKDNLSSSFTMPTLNKTFISIF